MLVLTEAAAEVVKSVTSAPQTPDGTGLRISSSASKPEDPGALQVTAADRPDENDQVIEADGARVFLEPQAAAYLDDKVLDGQLDEQGKAHFTLDVQDSGQI
jgi:Fe-S cluster assembly iron-binding protein IscA